MTVRPRRLVGLVPVAALLLLAFWIGCAAWCQEAPAPAKDAPSVSADKPSAASTSAKTPVQTGLPVELVIDPKKLDEQQKRLESALVYVRTNRPSGGFISRIGRSIGGLFSGGSRPRATTLATIAAAGSSLNLKLVAVEGLVKTDHDTQTLIAGNSSVGLVQLPTTITQGFPDNKPEGLPARVEGVLIFGEEGPIINLNQMTPAPSLSLVRLARCHELRDTASDYQQAVDLYSEAAGASSSESWSGFALAHGGKLAAEVLRNRKRAEKLYNQAWELEGRTKGHPGALRPTTWLQEDGGAWVPETLRAAVGQPLDALNRQGFWYKFVNTFVVLSGGNGAVGLILIAIVTRLLLYPLTRKQIKSAREMQRLQPEIKALQAKHGSDKAKFNEAFWKLCRDNKVNPLGGCLPLVIQMPLLIMVYRGIQAYVVQLAGHRFLWIPSLADPDLPLLVLYTISMIAFQKLTMKTQPIADPQQQQQQNMMVWMMPLMFFMFFQTLPAGFILYWLGTNLIYIPQQYFGTRVKPGEEGATQGSGERVTTLEKRPASNPGHEEPPASGGVGSWLKGLGGKPKEAEPEPPPSYEEKKLAEKRKRRRPTRRRRP
ncbi:MAG: membrane protein insertase YidC [Armatimonadetes bacterium]|nr:membrane protein insertase YidC [Armatimonadota bacterium]